MNTFQFLNSFVLPSNSFYYSLELLVNNQANFNFAASEEHGELLVLIIYMTLHSTYIEFIRVSVNWFNSEKPAADEGCREYYL